MRALEVLLTRRRSAEQATLATLALSRARLEAAQRDLTRLEHDLARACREAVVTGTALPARIEGAVATARSTVVLCRKECAELRDRAQAAMSEREAAEVLKARRTSEYAAREARKEERELDEANQA